MIFKNTMIVMSLLLIATTTTLASGAQTPSTVFRDCDLCPQMVVIPAGTYTMGADDITDDVKPPHPVTIAHPFAAGKFEVTFDEWDACVRERGCTQNPSDQGWGRGTRPVIHVSWADAQQYTQWLSLKTGQQYRLLSEAEWEYVARAGTTTPFNTGANLKPTQANYAGSETVAGSVTGVARNQTIAVGSYPANVFGLHDVHGNVWEWTEDCWNANHNGAPNDGRARTSGDCGQRVLRGGAWYDISRNLRSAIRNGFAPGSRVSGIGFRVARTF